jgi:hypothetical protein
MSKANKGPNGFPIGYTKDGDLVEWIPYEADRFVARGTIEDDASGRVGNVLLRGQKSIEAAREELRATFWYLYNKTKPNDDRLRHLNPGRLEEIKQEMEATEQKYGREKIRALIANDRELAILEGQMSALAWVIGWDWEEAINDLHSWE